MTIHTKKCIKQFLLLWDCHSTWEKQNKSSWNIRFDVLPYNDNVMENIACTKLSVLNNGEEEHPLSQCDQELMDSLVSNDQEDEREDASGESTSLALKKKKKKAEDNFLALDTEPIRVPTTYAIPWGDIDGEEVVWQIINDGTYITEALDLLDIPQSVEFQDGIAEGDNLDNPAEFFFKHVFLDIKGKNMLLRMAYHGMQPC